MAILVLLLPFLFVAIPPVTDLPQHLGQVILFGQAVSGQSEILAVNWFAPGNLVYVLLGATSLVFDPPLSGRIAMAILVLLWVGAIFVLAAAQKRPVESAVLGSIVVFNMSFYWGFINFMIGWPVFVLWLIYTSRPTGRRNGIILFVLSVLLYASHALWFAAAMLWLPVNALATRRPWKDMLFGAASALPVLILAVVWFPTLASSRAVAGADTAAHWYNPPWVRFSPSYLVDGIFGGIRGAMEPFAATIILLWIAAGVVTHRRHLWSLVDKRLLACALLFVLVMVLGPNKFVNTILFSKRWFPCAVLLLLLALPAPAGRPLTRLAAALSLVLVFSFGTVRAWRSYERVELSGLMTALDTLPPRQRVLGLDFVKASAYIKGRPFLQTFAYAQVFKEAGLNFSFAEHASGLVRHREPRPYDWTPGMTWAPERATAEDFGYFDYVLINGKPDVHTRLSGLDVIRPITAAGRWRLYKSLARTPIP